MRCKSCGREYAADEIFCRGCGIRLKEPGELSPTASSRTYSTHRSIPLFVIELIKILIFSVIGLIVGKSISGDASPLLSIAYGIAVPYSLFYLLFTFGRFIGDALITSIFSLFCGGTAFIIVTIVIVLIFSFILFIAWIPGVCLAITRLIKAISADLSR